MFGSKSAVEISLFDSNVVVFFSLRCDQGTCSLLQRYRANRKLSMDIEDVKVRDHCTSRGENYIE